MRPTLLLFSVGFVLFTSCDSSTLASQRLSGGKDAATTPSDTTQLAEYVVGAFVDSKGGRWFGTMNNGVARVVEGAISFIDTTRGLPPNGGHGIAEARDGTLWFAGHDGVYTYDPERGGGVKQVYATEARVSTDRRGKIWVSTMGRVYRWEGDVAHEFHVPVPKEPPAIFSITQRSLVFQMEDSKGNLWFSTDGHGAFRFDGKSFTRFTKKDGLCSNTPWDIIEDRAGRIWFACIQAYQPTMTDDGGLCVLEKDGSFTAFPDVEGLHHNDLYTLHLDRDGNVWSSAFRTGVYRINAEGITLFNATDRPDLNGNFGLQAMMQDKKGTLWCGFSGGLFRFDGSGFVNVTRGGPWE